MERYFYDTSTRHAVLFLEILSSDIMSSCLLVVTLLNLNLDSTLFIILMSKFYYVYNLLRTSFFYVVIPLLVIWNSFQGLIWFLDPTSVRLFHLLQNSPLKEENIVNNSQTFDEIYGMYIIEYMKLWVRRYSVSSKDKISTTLFTCLRLMNIFISLFFGNLYMHSSFYHPLLLNGWKSRLFCLNFILFVNLLNLWS